MARASIKGMVCFPPTITTTSPGLTLTDVVTTRRASSPKSLSWGFAGTVQKSPIVKTLRGSIKRRKEIFLIVGTLLSVGNGAPYLARLTLCLYPSYCFGEFCQGQASQFAVIRDTGLSQVATVGTVFKDVSTMSCEEDFLLTGPNARLTRLGWCTMVLLLPVLRFFVDTGKHEAQNRRRSFTFFRSLGPSLGCFVTSKRAHLRFARRTNMKMKSRWILVSAVVSLAAFLCVTVGLPVVQGSADHVRWDIINFNAATTPPTVSAGGFAIAAARNNPTTLTGSGTYEVRELISWQFANFQTPSIIDLIDDGAGANGNAVLRIEYSDGSNGVLGVGCHGPGSLGGIVEGVIATKDFVTYWDAQAPAGVVNANRTSFHVR